MSKNVQFRQITHYSQQSAISNQQSAISNQQSAKNYVALKFLVKYTYVFFSIINSLITLFSEKTLLASLNLWFAYSSFFYTKKITSRSFL